MKSVLPLPQQEGFELKLPPHVILATGTTMRRRDTRLVFVRNNKRISARVTDAAADALQAALTPSEGSPGMPTTRLAPVWRQLLQKIAAAGMLTCGAMGRADPNHVGALDVIVRIHDAIHTSGSEHFTTGHRFDAFLDGDLTRHLRRWITENYHYTKSATHHISPVLDHPLSDFEANVWSRFLADESWHWKIYRPSFAELGITMSRVDCQKPHRGTREFIALLRQFAERSPISYAAAMTFIEQPPLADEMDDDDLSAALMRHHRLSRKAVRPLWWHATENRTAGHSALGPIILSHREILTRQDGDDAEQAVRDTVRAVSHWQDAILS